ncbi:MAG: hypothetical protein ACQER9_02790 [Nanobdellota archaeon]
MKVSDKNNRYLKTVFFFFLLFLVILFSPIYFAIAEGCCVENEGEICTPMLESDKSNCEGEFKEKLCYPSVFDPDADYVEECSAEGCCMMEGVVLPGQTREICENNGGTFYEECPDEIPDEELKTCNDLNGYWCNTSNAPSDGHNITGRVTKMSFRPGENYYCYDKECIENTEECEKGNENSEIFCSDGVNNDYDCDIDAEDDDCSNNLKGQVIGPDGNPVSGVSLYIFNNDHKQNQDLDYYDSYSTYSVTNDGIFSFSGLSEGEYILKVNSENYNLEGGSTDSFSIPNDQEIEIQVIPKAVSSLEGNVKGKSGNSPLVKLENAVVLIKDYGYYSMTDENGDYSIDYISQNINNAQVKAFKQGYLEKNKRKTIQGETTLDFTLDSASCEFYMKKPVIEYIGVVPGKNKIKLEFNAGGCSADIFEIYKCEGSDCSDNRKFHQIKELEGNNINYIDDDIRWEKNYSYYIKSISGNIESNPSLIKTIYSGDKICGNKYGEGSFCVPDEKTKKFNFKTDNEYYEVTKGMICDDKNRVKIYTGPTGPVICKNDGTNNQKCIEIDSGKESARTKCIEIDECASEEDNYMGLYFDEDKCEGNDNEKFCVYDYSKTNKNYCFSCQYYSDCSDYNSKNACIENNCQLGQCNWFVTDQKLGQGFCHDVSDTECQECGGSYNDIFSSCPPDICSSFGNCAYNINEDECSDCNEITCYDYQNPDDCGYGSTISIDQSTNKYILESDDQCQNSNCRWDSQKDRCYKDADIDYKDDCEYLKDEVIIPKIDGHSIYSLDDCKEDDYLPKTTISMSRKEYNPENNQYIKINFTSYDKTGTESERFDVKDIYYCISPENSNWCNFENSFEKTEFNSQLKKRIITLGSIDSRGRISPIGGKKFYISEGKNIIRYYAKDHSGNLEIIKEENFKVDTQPPEINITEYKIPYKTDRKTDVNIMLTSNEKVYCEVEFSGCEAIGNCDNNNINTDNLSQDYLESNKDEFSYFKERSFKKMEDGHYSLNIVCTDISGNIKEKSYDDILLDADPRIRDPAPKNIIDNNQVQLKVKTIKDVQCKYTESLDKSFESIPSHKTMQSKPSGNLYIHSKQISLSQSKTYDYYVICNYDGEAIERISFTIDTLKPSTTLKAGGLEIDEGVGWINNGKISFSCKDDPLNGFGCNKTKFCTNPVPNIFNLQAKNTCNPDKTYQGNDIEIKSPRTVCFMSTENKLEEYGGKEEDTKCLNIFVDKTTPSIYINSIPKYTNENSLSVTGKVYDSFKKSSISFSRDKEFENILDMSLGLKKTYSSFMEKTSSESKEMMLRTNLPLGTYNEILNENGEDKISGQYYIFFDYKSPRNYGALVFDFSKDKIYLEIKDGSVKKYNIDSGLGKDYYKGNKDISISKEDRYIDVKIKEESGKTIKYSKGITDLSKIDGEKLGVLIKDKSNDKLKEAFYGKNIDLFNYYNLKTFNKINKKVFIELNGNIKKVIGTKGSFSYNSMLSRNNPKHGQKFNVKVYSESVSGKKGNEENINIVYDLSGPFTKKPEFLPTIDQETNDYIEYGSSADISFEASDDYSGIRSISLSIRDETFEIEDKGNSWKSRLDLSNIPIGKHDVKITSYDNLGNKNIQLFEDALIIKDKINPFIVDDGKNGEYYYNENTPELKLETYEPASCRIKYISDAGSQITQQISSSRKTRHSVKLNEPLSSEKGKEINTESTLICEDVNGNKIVKIINIIIDKRFPIYSINLDDSNLKPLDIKRDSETYLGFSRFSKTFHVFSDEPVKCRYTSNNKEDFENMDKYFLGNNYSKEKKTPSIFINTPKDKDFKFICRDRAGNDGIIKHIGIKTDKTSKPYLFNLPETIYMNQEYMSGNIEQSEKFMIEFTSMRDIDCSYEINGKTGNFQQTYASDLFETYSFKNDFQGQINKGLNKMKVICNSPDTSKKLERTINIFYDKDSPILKLGSTKQISELNKIDIEKTMTIMLNKVESNESSEELVPSSIDSEKIILPLKSNEKVYIKSYINGKLQEVEKLSSTLTLELNYGMNNIILETIDKANNHEYYNMKIISTKKGIDNKITSFPYGSLVNGIDSKIIIKQKESSGNPIKLNIKSHDSDNDIKKFMLESSKSGNDYIYNINLSRQNLYEIYKEYSSRNLSEGYHEYKAFSPETHKIKSLDIQNPFDIKNGMIMNLRFSDLDNNTYSKGTIYYSPFSEEYKLMKTKEDEILENNLINKVNLEFSGQVKNENYLQYSKDDYYDFNTRSFYLRKERADKLEMERNIFNESYKVKKGYSGLYMSFYNDMNMKTMIDTSLFYDYSAPEANIEIYPEGDISYTKNPVFSISFNEPAKIISLNYTDLSNTSSIGGYSKDDFIFKDNLRIKDDLQENKTYYLNAVYEDKNGNIGEEQKQFTYIKRPLTLELLKPIGGYLSKKDAEIILKSDRLAKCIITKNDTFDLGKLREETSFKDDYKIYHKLNITVQNKTKIYAKCKPYGGDISNKFSYNLEVDTTPPVIEQINFTNSEIINGVPFINSYPLSAQIDIKTDDPTNCRYSLIKMGENHTNDFDFMETPYKKGDCNGIYKNDECYSNNKSFTIMNLQDKNEYEAEIKCINLPGLISPSEKIYFQVNLEEGNKIKIIKPYEYELSKSIDIKAETNIPGKCYFGIDNQSVSTRLLSSQGNTLHKKSLNIDEGKHLLKLSCKLKNKTYNKTKTFTLDTTPPEKGSIITRDNTTSRERLDARAVNFTDEESGIAFYEYAVGDTIYGRKGWNMLKNWTQTKRSVMSVKNVILLNDTTYYWHIRAMNEAGQYSSIASSTGTEIISINKNIFNEQSCSDGKKNNGETGVDCGKVCNKSCPPGTSCIFDSDCYSDDLVCSENNECIHINKTDDFEENLPDDDIILNDTIKNESYENDEIEPGFDQKDTRTEVTKKSNKWIYFLMAFGLLIMMGGGGYYYYSTKQNNNKGGSSASAPGQETSSDNTDYQQNNFAGTMSMNNNDSENRKEALKEALKRKLADQQKEAAQKDRNELFDNFTSEGSSSQNENNKNHPSDKKSSVSSASIKRNNDSNIKNKKEISEKAARIKQKLDSSENINHHFKSHPEGEAVNSEKLKKEHQNLVEDSFKDKENSAKNISKNKNKDVFDKLSERTTDKSSQKTKKSTSNEGQIKRPKDSLSTLEKMVKNNSGEEKKEYKENKKNTKKQKNKNSIDKLSKISSSNKSSSKGKTKDKNKNKSAFGKLEDLNKKSGKSKK